MKIQEVLTDRPIYKRAGDGEIRYLYHVSHGEWSFGSGQTFILSLNFEVCNLDYTTPQAFVRQANPATCPPEIGYFDWHMFYWRFDDKIVVKALETGMYYKKVTTSYLF